MRSRLIFHLLAVFLLILLVSCGQDEGDTINHYSDDPVDDDDTGDDDGNDTSDDDDNSDDDDDVADDDDDDDTSDDDDDSTRSCAIHFPANDASVVFAPSVSFWAFTSSLTLEAWIKVDGYQDDMAHIVAHILDDNGYSLHFNSNNILEFLIIDGDDAHKCVNHHTGILTPNEWYHVAGVFDDGACHLYVNGQEVDEDISTAYFVGISQGSLYFGSTLSESGFLGTIDEARLSRNAEYSIDFTPLDYLADNTGVAGLWHMDEGAGAYTYDSSVEANRGTLYGGADWVSSN